MAGEQQQETTDTAAEPAKSGRKKSLIMGGIVLGVMIVEAVVVFLLVKSFSPPQSATASEAGLHGAPGLDPHEGEKKPMSVEVKVVKFRARNDKSAEPIIYDFEVFATVADEKGEEFKKLMEGKQATLQDRFSAVVRSADPQRFLEPDLATFRERFKIEIAQVIEDDKVVKEVLIPSVVSYRE